MLERFLFHVYRLFGLAPVKRIGKGDYRLLKLFHFVYSTLLICSVIEFNDILIEQLGSSNMNTRALVNIIEVFTTSTAAAVCVALSYNVWSKVIDCPKEYELGEPVNGEPFFSLIKLCQVATAFEFLVVAYCYCFWANLPGSPPAIRLMQFYFYHLILVMQSLMSVSILNRAIVDLKRMNQLVIRSIDLWIASSIEYSVWNAVKAECISVRQWINKVVPAQGWSVATNLLFVTLLLITSPYRTLFMLKRANSSKDLEFEYIYLNTLWTMAYVSRLSALLTFYHLTKKHDLKTIDIALDYLNKELPENIQDELVTFLRDQSERRIDLTAARLYPIDHSCIKSVINNITTYLALLLTYKNNN